MKLVDWDATLNEALRSLCAGEEILSYREIAQRLSRQCGVHFTKNMVIGKARRLGIPSRPKKKTDGALRHRSNVINLNRLRRVGAPIVPLEEETMEPHCKRTFDQLRLEHECHFPYGDRHPVLFCGDPKMEEGPYCQYHHEVAHRQGRIPYADYRDKQTGAGQ